MERKVLEPLVLNPARAGRLQKPVLVIAITDGSPAGEPRDQVRFRPVIPFCLLCVLLNPIGLNSL